MADLTPPPGRTHGAWRLEAATTIALAWPLILTNLVEVALTTTDVLLMGRIGPTALAAGALATNLFFAFAIPGLGVVIAVSPLVANELGARLHAVKEVRRTVRQGLWTAAIISVGVIAILSQTETILVLLRQKPELAALAADYMHMLMWSMPAFLGYIALRSAVAALGRPHSALWAAIVAIAVNAFLAYALMFGAFGFPNLGLVGGGLATAIATWLMFFVLAAQILLDRGFRRYHMFGRWWEADWTRFADIWRVGLPIGIALAFEVTTFAAAAFLMGQVDQDSLAAHAIAIQLCSITFMVPLGIGQAATVRVGLAYGGNDRAGVALAGRVAFALGTGFMLLAAGTMLLVPEVLARFFVDAGDPANRRVIELTALFLFFGGLFQLADGTQVVVAGMLRGLQDTRVPMILAGIGYWGVGVPLAYVLAFWTDLGGVGIWIGLAAGLSLVAVPMTLRWRARHRLGLMPVQA